MSICAVCREVMNDGTYKLPECGHEYHLECIMTWWRSPRDYNDRCSFGECPQCRRPSEKTICWRSLPGRVKFLKKMARKKNAHPLLKKAYNNVQDKVNKMNNAKKEYNEYKRKTEIKAILTQISKLRDKKWKTQMAKNRAEMELATFDPMGCLIEEE